MYDFDFLFKKIFLRPNLESGEQAPRSIGLYKVRLTRVDVF